MWSDTRFAAGFSLAWLIIVTFVFAFLRKPAGEGDSRNRLMGLSLSSVILVAAAVRLVPALLLPIGAGYDIESYKLVTDALLSGREVYTSALGRHPYLPFQMYIMGGAALLSQWTALPFVVAIKLPTVAADAAITGLIYTALSREGSRREIAAYFGLLYALNPVSILITAYHGQFESITLFLLVLAWMYWRFGRHRNRSAVALGLAILNKTWPVIFLPVMLIRQREWRARAVYTALAVGVPVVFAALYLVLYSADARPMLGRALSHRGVPGYWGPGAVLAPAGNFSTAAASLFAGLVAIRNWLLAAAVLYALWRTRHADALVALLTVILSMLAVSVGFGNQWLVWPLPFALLARQDKPARWYTLAATVMATVHLYGANMVTWLPPLQSGSAADWVFRLSALPAWIGVVIWAVSLLRVGPARETLVVRLRRPAAWLAVLCLGAGVALVMLTQTRPDISDPIGYLYAGQQLAAGNGLRFEDPNNQIAGPYFTLYAFQVTRSGDPAHYLGFPPGLPLLLAAGTLTAGDSRAIHYVVPLLAILTLVATYYLGIALTGDAAAGLWSAVIMVATTAFWQFGSSAWSEIPATLAATFGVFLYLRSRQAGGHPGYSLLAALILSFGIFIRYTNVVFFAALGIYELYTARHRLWSERWRWTFWLAAAAGVVAIPIFNHFYYGGALVTSYSPEHGWYPLPPFSLAYALGPSFVDGYSLRESLKTLWANFPILLLAAPLGWWFLPAAGRVLTASAVGFGFLAYSFYAFAPVGINSRFVLPMMPFIAIAIAQFLRVALCRIRRPAPRRAAGIAVAAALAWFVASHWGALQTRNERSDEVIALVQRLVDPLETDAVVLSYAFNDLVAYYSQRSPLAYRRIPASDEELGRYRTEMLEPCLVGSVSRLLDESVPVYYIEDTQPPYWDSLAILHRHFAMTAMGQSPPLYRIIERTSSDTLDESECRFP